MNSVAQPQGTDILLEIGEGSGWRIVCPPRSRLQFAGQGVAGIVAGILLGGVSGGGIADAMTNPSWGAQLFVLGWLGPLAIIALLLVWLGLKTLARLWQTTVVESQGAAIRHRTRSPWSELTIFEVPLSRVEPFEVPSLEDTPDLGDPTARKSFRGSFVLRYRRDEGNEVLRHPCMAGVRYDELEWLAAALNPILTSRQR